MAVGEAMHGALLLAVHSCVGGVLRHDACIVDLRHAAPGAQWNVANTTSGASMTTMSPFGEHSLTVVAASFADRESAEKAASNLRLASPATHGEVGSVTVVPPGDPAMDRTLEPEDHGIWRTLLRSHLLFGIAGAAAGAAVAAMAVALQWPAATLSPMYTTLFAVMLGGFFGMLVAGLLTLRPDHGTVIRKVHEFSRRGRWSVVARPLDEAGSKAAFASLAAAGRGAVRSL
jgi:hypothetical protein